MQVDYKMLQAIQVCFQENRLLYTQHARHEMVTEEFGQITEEEVFQAVQNGEVIESYEYDTPYPSVLIFGETVFGRPIHAVIAYSEEDNLAIVVTVYEPDPARWINHRRRILSDV